MPIQYTKALSWQEHDAGLAQAKALRRPVLVTLHADWCEACRRFARLLDDPGVITAAWNFVAINIDVDQHPELAARYAPDGAGYLPRTYLLTPEGVVMRGLPAPRVHLKVRRRYTYSDARTLIAALELGERLATTARPGEDPSAFTEAEVCADPSPALSVCGAAARPVCCPELVTCINDPGCSCRLMTGNLSSAEACGRITTINSALATCLSNHCAAACPAGLQSL
jgi:hypothetical protein